MHSVAVFITTYTTGFGITAGVHRLWSHRAYKAKWPLRLLLIFLFTITGQVYDFFMTYDFLYYNLINIYKIIFKQIILIYKKN